MTLDQHMYGYGLPFAWLAQAMCPHHSATWRAVRRRPAAAMGLHFEHQRQLLAYLPAISADLPCARSNVAWGRQTAGGSTARLTSEAIWHQLLAHPSKPDSITHCTFLTPRLPPPRFFCFMTTSSIPHVLYYNLQGPGLMRVVC
jgi:hypothetical protein